jgi:hypothetical protein
MELIACIVAALFIFFVVLPIIVNAFCFGVVVAIESAAEKSAKQDAYIRQQEEYKAGWQAYYKDQQAQYKAGWEAYYNAARRGEVK